MTDGGLEIKPSSRQYLCCAGQDRTATDSHKWERVTELNVLGHRIAEDGGNRRDWNRTRGRMWGIFWSNVQDKMLDIVSLLSKLRLLDQVVVSQLLFKLACWVPSKTIGIELDGLQTAMISIVLKVPRQLNESDASYHPRKNSLAKELATKTGRWSTI